MFPFMHLTARQLVELRDSKFGGCDKFYVRPCLPSQCRYIVLLRNRVEDEPLDELARVSVWSWDYEERISTAADLVQLFYLTRDVPRMGRSIPREPLWFQVPHEPSEYLGDWSLRSWEVHTVVLLPSEHSARRFEWTSDELVAAIAKMKAERRAEPVDPAELPGGDDEI